MRQVAFFAAAVTAAAANSTALASPLVDENCQQILPPSHVTRHVRRLEPEDLVGLRDIGPVDPHPWAAPFFTISPDGSKAAFQLRQAHAAANGYCLAMVVIDLSKRTPARIVDLGGQLLLLTIDNRGISRYPTGITSMVTPRWSSDGRWIAFLKRSAGTTQVWRAMADGGGSVPLTSSATDVVDFRLGDNGTTLIYATEPGLEKFRSERAVEARKGFHFDDRFWPFASNLPFPRSPVAREVKVLELSTGNVREASKEEAAHIGAGQGLIATSGAVPDGQDDLWISATDLSGGALPASLHARMRDGRTAVCDRPECKGALNPWWMPGKQRVRFIRRTGWARSSTAIYEWIPARKEARQIYITDDVLASCTPTGKALACLRESSLQPRRLELLDPATGMRQTIFDPNPEFARLTLGSVRRLRWRNSFGVETVGDLVLPVGYRSGQRYPLVVVQYDTRGFLRGGTGDEYPVQAFANRGYAVLSFSRPEAIGDIRGSKDFTEARRQNLEAFADRRSVHSSLERGVQLAIELGIADPKRIGITGLSDGASTATWALIHSSIFSAAAISSCCIDTTLAMRVGPGRDMDFLSIGYPGLLERSDPFWTEISLSLNARRISTPILMQLADDEYLDALESFSALREAGSPVDMYVFPGEHHVKWQPAHRLAIYRRSIDWFDYWLRGVRSKSAERKPELKNWDMINKIKVATSPR